jgi:nitrogen regulatory protein P-II 1
MKKIEAVIRPSALKKVLEGLKAIGYPGVTVTNVQGHGKQKGITESYRGQNVEGLLPKLMIMVVVDDEKAVQVLEVITKSSRTGEMGDGKIFVTPVEEVYRIRTGDQGTKAL